MITATYQKSRTGKQDIILTSDQHRRKIRVFFSDGVFKFQKSNQSIMHRGKYHEGLVKLEQRGW